MDGRSSPTQHEHLLPHEQAEGPAYGSVTMLGGDSEQTVPMRGTGEQAPASPSSYAHPPNDNFHDHEYGKVSECIQCNGVDPLVGSWVLQVAAFFVGTGLSISWSVVYISEAYFESVLGKSVLSKLGSTVDGLTLAGMLLFMGVRRFLSYRGIILVHFLYGAILALTIPGMVATDMAVTSTTVYILMSLLGMSAGMAKAAGGAIAGLYPGASFSSAMLLGSSFSAMAPTAVETYLLAASAQHTDHTSSVNFAGRQQLYTVFAMGLLFSLIALWSGWRSTGTRAFRQARVAEKERLQRVDVQVGKNKIAGRIRTTGTFLLVLVFSWTLCIYTLSLCPLVHSRGDLISSNAVFWKMQLPTCIIACANVGFFSGNFVSSKLLKRGHIHSSRAHIVTRGGVMLLLAVAVPLLLYIRSPFLTQGGNMFVLFAYYALCAVTGFLSNATSALAQLECSFVARHLCPIIGTLCWFAVQSGIFLGAALSFAPVN